MNAGSAAFPHLPSYVPSDDVIGLAKAKQISFMTTLSVYESLSGGRLRQLEFIQEPLIADTSPPWFLDDLRAKANRPLAKEAEAAQATMLLRLQAAQRNVKKLWNAGVPVVAGTDAPYPGDFQGEGIHHELELLVEAGLTPVEAITAATKNAAELMKAAEWGMLEPGKFADLVLVAGRPDQQIRDTRNVEMVIKGGTVLNRQQLKLSAGHDPGFRTSSSINATAPK